MQINNENNLRNDTIFQDLLDSNISAAIALVLQM